MKNQPVLEKKQVLSTRAALLFLAFLSAGPFLWAEGECRTFRECHERGKAARAKENYPLALKFFKNACAMDVRRFLIGYKFSSCNQVIEFSKTVDDYATARTFFEDQCGQNIDNGCFFLAKLEEDQGNLAKAMELMKPLCKSKFRHKGVFGYGGCEALKIMKLKWRSLNPDPPEVERAWQIQLPAFGAVFFFVLLSLISVVRSYTKKTYGPARRALVFSILAFGVYVFYESGVPGHAAIRLDLLLLFPALILNIGLIVVAAVKSRNKREEGSGP